MGIWKVDNVSSKEWEKRMRRRHEAKQWMILLVEIALMVGAVLFVMWIMSLEVI